MSNPTNEGLKPCSHRNRDAGYTHLTCNDCGWVHPDVRMWREHGLNLNERNSSDENAWFPSLAAFETYARTCERPWLNTRAEAQPQVEPIEVSVCFPTPAANFEQIRQELESHGNEFDGGTAAGATFHLMAARLADLMAAQIAPAAPKAESALVTEEFAGNLINEIGGSNNPGNRRWVRVRVSAVVQQAIDAAKPTQAAGKSAEEWSDAEFYKEEAETAKADLRRLRDEMAQAAQSKDGLRETLVLARKRIEYLGIACEDNKHFEANEKTFIPQIDKVLAALVTQPEGEVRDGRKTKTY